MSEMSYTRRGVLNVAHAPSRSSNAASVVGIPSARCSLYKLNVFPAVKHRHNDSYAMLIAEKAIGTAK